VPDPLSFRTAARDDLAAIVRMLAADPLGATRESVTEPLAPEYEAAFAAIRDDPNNELLVAECGTALAGVLQLTYLPSLTYQGGWRAQVEGVRVAEGMRGQGVGRALLEEAIARARSRGCRLVQLTTDSRRPEALRFYEQLGFRATHAGMKLQLGR
jgi:GNAT superfamily N-acetyltransferase